MSTLLIGDVHGKINEYLKIINKTKFSTIQLGDFGFKKQHNWHLKNIDNSKHKILFGNHDDYTFLNENHSLGDYYSNDNYMCVRGAYSIDQHHRIENVDWWRNEELSYNEMIDAIDHYNTIKPKIMLTHDCPQIIRQHIFGITEKSITSNALQMMFENHQPDTWVFGHHHRSVDVVIKNTRFVCLNELETMVI